MKSFIFTFFGNGLIVYFGDYYFWFIWINFHFCFSLISVFLFFVFILFNVISLNSCPCIIFCFILFFFQFICFSSFSTSFHFFRIFLVFSYFLSFVFEIMPDVVSLSACIQNMTIDPSKVLTILSDKRYYKLFSKAFITNAHRRFNFYMYFCSIQHAIRGRTKGDHFFLLSVELTRLFLLSSTQKLCLRQNWKYLNFSPGKSF